MKRNLRNNLTITKRQLTMGAGISKFVVLAFMLILIACTNSDTAHEHDTYTCPMHPTVVSDRLGTCPICGMDLVRKSRPGESVEITEDLSKLLRSPSQTVVASVNTIRGQYKSLPVSVNAQGVVTYDTRNIYTIPARIGGRLEKIYLKYEFQAISKGQKIAEIYSPELITAQRELIFLLENDPENKPLIDAATRKLALLGMTSVQINQLTKRKEAGNTISIYSPHSGYLITGQQAPAAPLTMPSAQSPGGAMIDGMSGPASTSAQPRRQGANTGTIVREGAYVTAGETLFTLVNASALRIELNVPGSSAGDIKEGRNVKLDLGNGQQETATVDFIQPFFDEGQQFMKMRVYTKRRQGLHVGHLVNATISVESGESLWIPKEAVLDLGTQKVVFLKEGGVLKPKEVTTGMTSEGLIEIKGGLASTEEIAANAQFLVDSESFIRVGK